MFAVRGLKKQDLLLLSREIYSDVSEDLRFIELKELIVDSDEYKKDQECLKCMLQSIIEERKMKDESERLERLEMGKIESDRIERLEKFKLEKEHELELAKLTTSNSDSRNMERQISLTKNSNVAESLENLIRSVKTLTIDVPTRPESWNLYFSSLERAFKIKNVQEEVKSEIVLNLLGEKATNALIHIKEEELINYDYVKKLILKEYEPTAQACFSNFKKAKRQSGETHSQFAARLTSNWKYYCKLRNANDLNTLHELIISDKLLQTLDQETATHISIKQGDSWLKPSELAKECDIFYACKRKSFDETVSSTYKSYNSNETDRMNTKYIPPHLRKYDGINRTKKECFVCGGNHLARNCTQKFSKNIKPRETETNNALAVQVKAEYLKPHDRNVEIQPLKYVNILIEGNDIEACLDSGCQIMMLNPAFIPNWKWQNKSCGKILLTSAFGETINADLTKLSIALKNYMTHSHVTHPVEVVVAVSDKLSVGCLLPPNIYDLLQATNRKGEGEAETPDIVVDSQKHVERGEEIKEQETKVSILLTDEVNNLDSVKKGSKGNDNTYSEALKIKDEQLKCNTLAGVISDLKLGKGNFVLIEGLIYHKDKILSETIMQLVLPEIRRKKVLHLAHESVFGSHMGMRKTKERIRYNFYWPKMSKDIKEYCKTCKNCQLRAVIKVTDRAPISAVARPSLPFEMVNIDIIGKIEPSSGRGHSYILCLMDQHTRWPEAIPLRSITAKATCEALLQIFSRTGIPNIIASDQGTNFTSALTQGLRQALCEAPKLYTPVYDKPFTIQTDASAFGVGSCLSQRNDQRILHPISFASQKLSKTQQRWATIEREAYAIVWSLKQFETWVFGAQIELITDHNPLVFHTKSAPQSAKLRRWSIALQRYNISIAHSPDARLKNADGLSKLVE